jgi:putative membrane protein
MWWWHDYGYLPGPWMFGPFMMIFGLLICAAVMYFMMRGMMGHGSSNGRSLEILKERFARGEITQAQYEEQRRLLEV